MRRSIVSRVSCVSRMSRKLRVVLAVALAAALAIALLPRARAGGGAGALQLLTGFSAKEVCSCAFVVEQTDAYCQAFGQQPGYDVTITIDRTAKTATATFLNATRTAHFVDGAGCTLDGL